MSPARVDDVSPLWIPSSHWTHGFLTWAYLGLYLSLFPANLCSIFCWLSVQFSSVQFSSVTQLYPTLCDLMDCMQHARPLCPSPTPGTYSNSCPLSQWCHLTISSPVVPFSSCPQSFPASESFPMAQFFTLGGQSFEVSASTSVLPMNTQDWSPLGWTDWISLQSKALSGVFSNAIVQKHQFFCPQLSL